MASTVPILARTVSRATRLLWMSDRTAIRTGSNLAVRRSPWPTLARRGVPRVGRRDASPAGRDDQPITVEPGHVHLPDGHRAAAERGDRPFRGDQLGRQVAALPGDQDPA